MAHSMPFRTPLHLEWFVEPELKVVNAFSGVRHKSEH